jgi:putative ABC transport system ATP-binding protein
MATAAAPTVVRVDRLNYYFGDGESRTQVLFNNSLEISAGQLVVMTGPSGSGKTTLLTLIGTLRRIQEGRIELLGRDLARLTPSGLVGMRRDIGFIFQMHNLFDSLSAYENVRMAMQLSDRPAAEIRQRCLGMLERLGLGQRVDHKPKALSGGQRQRVAVARALVNRPRLVLADEPTAALDRESSRDVVALLKEIAVQDGATIIMVTHDNRVLEMADRIVNMVDGSIISDVIIDDAVMICQFLASNKLFKELSPTALTNVAERVKRRRYLTNETVIRQGDIGEEFFILVDGKVDVLQRSAAGEKRVAQLGRGDCFGEAALMSGDPRNATIVAREAVEVYVLDKAGFNAAMDLATGFKEEIVRIYFQRQ